MRQHIPYSGIYLREMLYLFVYRPMRHTRIFLYPPSKGNALYPGTIAAANADGTFAVAYDDGDMGLYIQRKGVMVSLNYTLLASTDHLSPSPCVAISSTTDLRYYIYIYKSVGLVLITILGRLRIHPKHSFRRPTPSLPTLAEDQVQPQLIMALPSANNPASQQQLAAGPITRACYNCS